MRELLAPLAFTRRYFTATVGPRGHSPGGPTLCLRDVRCAETGELLADHVWTLFAPRDDPHGLAVIGRRIRFRARVMPYRRAGGGGLDYHLSGVRHIGVVVREASGR